MILALNPVPSDQRPVDHYGRGMDARSPKGFRTP